MGRPSTSIRLQRFGPIKATNQVDPAVDHIHKRLGSKPRCNDHASKPVDTPITLPRAYQEGWALQFLCEYRVSVYYNDLDEDAALVNREYEDMKRFSCTVMMLLLSGCGSATGRAPAECPDGANCTGDGALQATPGSMSAEGAVTISAAFAEDPDDSIFGRSTDDDSPSAIRPALDPFESGGLSASDVDLLLSLMVDNLVLELVTPADLDNDLSLLERLCREGETPDFRCRQRFGD